MTKQHRQQYLGVMTGTSVDGIDIALVDCSEDKPHLLQAAHFEYPQALRLKLLTCIKDKSMLLSELNAADTEVGKAIAESCLKFCNETKTNANDITAIGTHGQTLCHSSTNEHPNTLQIGNPNVICQITGINTVSDFRRADIAQGGQGAPLAPVFHQSVFQSADEERIIVNIGGIANITYLPKDINQPIEGFDTGPGNALLDAWIYKQLNLPFDDQGKFAAQGTVNEALLNDFLSDAYFELTSPKSTGKEHFNLDWIRQKTNQKELSNENIQATLCELTAVSIVRAIQKYPPDSAVYLCGGGVNNHYLVSRLQRHLATQKIESTSALGIDPQWIEAAAFAWLAHCRIEGRKTTCAKITGASNQAHLGAVYLA